MCGIVGYTGHDDALGFLTPALKRLEYRGYDSAGIAMLGGNGLEIRKSIGKIAQLENLLSSGRPSGHLGIAHTRWATHGRPSEVNAHPQVDCKRRLAVVHNGIIENHRELRAQLVAEGHCFRSETDTEVIAHLIERYQAYGLAEAVRRAASCLHGSFAVACISDEAPDTLVALRGGGSSLVLGFGDHETYLASDFPALLGRTRQTIVLAEGELAVLTPNGVTIRRLDGCDVHREPTPIVGDAEAIEKGSHPHFMLKEIFEQPQVVRTTLMERVDAAGGRVDLPEIGLVDRELARLAKVALIACGTSWHAALVGRYLIEEFARLPAEAEIASELRHRKPLFDSRTLLVPISQSGETADTLAALRQALPLGAKSLGICNMVGSSMAREAQGLVATRAGIEIGVAATKTFTAQLVAVLLLALRLAAARCRMDPAAVRDTLRFLAVVPDLMEEQLGENDRIRQIAERFDGHTSALYLGRGLQYPMALEGALKMKEVSYLHAEGCAAGEMKHGPIALIDKQMPVVVLAPKGPTFENVASNMQEVKARDAMVLALATRGDESMASLADAVIPIPPVPHCLQPLLMAIPLQLLAYHVAVRRGCDVDQPRNLAKSVTVE